MLPFGGMRLVGLKEGKKRSKRRKEKKRRRRIVFRWFIRSRIQQLRNTPNSKLRNKFRSHSDVCTTVSHLSRV